MRRIAHLHGSSHFTIPLSNQLGLGVRVGSAYALNFTETENILVPYCQMNTLLQNIQ